LERAIGIGGLFFRAKDPGVLARWYRNVLGIDAFADGEDIVWWPQAGPTVFAPFAADTDYFGRADQVWMLNVRVRDLDAMLAQVRAHDAVVVGGTQDMVGIGRFGWVVDPEGNRIELWEPDAAALVPPSGA
jgi:predicted enzyme related to lactoylglutathione lyase